MRRHLFDRQHPNAQHMPAGGKGCMARAVMKRRTAACVRKRITRGVYRPRKITEPERVVRQDVPPRPR